ncbi:MAG TPA: glycosyltransferase family 39 protein [Burkholderiales bacterium]|nr:glycosyltransferase family 39 protein [Burkholderiales bacterium]
MTATRTRRWLLVALAATLLFRLWFAAFLPVTADEAYFILWGRSPALGYYDHPPMVGWLLAPLAALTEAPWLMRLPAVLVPPAAALMLGAALVRWFGRDAQTADLAALAVLLMPVNVLNVLITTDTPLVLFSVAATLVLARAAQRDSSPLYLAAGVLLGLAFLSKYFAVLLGLAFFVWAALARRPRALLLVLLGALPFGLINLYWNYEACWCNVMFNGINRHVEGHSGWSPSKPALYAAALAYVAAPLFWFAWRGRRQLAKAWRRPAEGALLLAWILPLAVFTLLAPVKTIGLHWLLSFLPALVASVALALAPQALASSVRWFALLAVLHAVPIAVIAALPLETWRDTRLYSRLVFPGRIAELMAAAGPSLAGKVLATDSYASAALLEYQLRRSVVVFGRGTSHARQDDIDTDWRALDGRDIVILRRQPSDAGEYAPYFRELDEKVLTLGGGNLHLYIGTGFDYGSYRAHVLADIRERYYRIPALLPVGRCYFFERYFPGGAAS